MVLTFLSHNELEHELHNQKMMAVPLFGAGPKDHPRYIIPSSSAVATKNSSDPFPIIHIVYTRFMQHQPDLVSLGLARLELLKDFFLASLQGQTTDNFLVVIRTDPELNRVLKQPLLELFPNRTSSTKGHEQHHNFRYLVVGTNENPKSHQYEDILRRLKDGEGLWSGTMEESWTYLQGGSASRRLILETRLDSDDGLHGGYVMILQNEARRALLLSHSGNTNEPNNDSKRITSDGSWKIWCAGKYLEWQYMAPWDLESSKKQSTSELRVEKSSAMDNTGEEEEKEDESDDEETDDDKEDDGDGDGDEAGEIGVGALVSLQFKGCLSAGLSMAYFDPPVNKTETIPTLQNHESLAATVVKCRGSKGTMPARKTNCLSFLTLNPSVLRARTPTSAGMLNILWDWNAADNLTSTTAINNNTSDREKKTVETSELYQKYHQGAIKQRRYQAKLWDVVEHVFRLSPIRIRELREYFRTHMVAIAEDNLRGQCSNGHSCKNSSQAMLRSIVGT